MPSSIAANRAYCDVHYDSRTMSTKKRQRELARRKYERQTERRQHSRMKRRTTQQIIAVVVVAALVLGSLAAWILTRPDSEAPAAAGSPAATPVCTEPATVREDTLSWPQAPQQRTFDSAPLLRLDTNCGPITIQTLPELAPQTVSSEIFLAESGFYDGTACHRVTTAGIFVLQCGDPAGDGTGGPGYTIPDENFPGEGAANYPAGTVAMANAGPGTSGSQFFLVYEDTTLPAAYTIWGFMTEGLDIVRAVAASGTAEGGSDGSPAQPVVIESATVSTGTG